LLDGVAVDGR